MKLERYNQVLGAVFGTAVIAGGAALLAVILVAALFSGEKRSIVLYDPETEPPPQELVFCTPVLVKASGIQLFPVAAVDAKDPESPRAFLSSPVSMSISDYASAGCGFGRYGRAGNLFNVVIRGPETAGERLLLEHPAQIESLHQPGPECEEGEGPLPCNLLHWEIRNRDSNGDGVIDAEDASIAFVSDINVSSLRSVTPPDAELIGYTWDPVHHVLIYQVRRDRNRDGKFDAADGIDLMELDLDAGEKAVAQPILGDHVRRTLLAAIR